MGTTLLTPTSRVLTVPAKRPPAETEFFALLAGIDHHNRDEYHGETDRAHQDGIGRSQARSDDSCPLDGELPGVLGALTVTGVSAICRFSESNTRPRQPNIWHTWRNAPHSFAKHGAKIQLYSGCVHANQSGAPVATTFGQVWCIGFP